MFYSASSAIIDVNSTSAGSQQGPYVGKLADGGFVVGYFNNAYFSGSTYIPFKAFFQRYDTQGNAIGPEVTLSNGTSSAYPTFETLANGNLVVAWNAGTENPDHYDLQIYDPAGNPIGATIHSNEYGGYALSGSGLDIAALAGGGFVVSSFQYTSAGSEVTYSFALDLFDSDGQMTGRTLENANGQSGFDRVAALEGGGFVLAYQMYTGQNGNDVFLRIFHANGSAAGAAFRPDGATVGYQSWPAVAGMPGGGFVASWTDNDNQQVFRIFDEAGSAAGDTVTAGFPGYSQVQLGVMPNGDIAIEDTDTSGRLRMHLYSASGVALGDPIIVTLPEGHRGYYGSTVALDAGHFALVWNDSSNDDPADIRAQIYNADWNLYLKGTDGADTLKSGDSAALVTRLDGYDGNDVLNGGTGVDLMLGGRGNDTYFVRNAGDRVAEGAAQGRDEVRAYVDYTLGANVEDLRLYGSSVNGTGNGLDNRILGNELANSLFGLTGNDQLYGYGGADQLDGGNGNDRLFGGEGNDTIYAGDGNDLLDGGAGADFMDGNYGNDIYMVDAAGDVVSEIATGGTADEVRATLDYTLTANVERLRLYGDATRGTGNDGDNVIYGTAGTNLLQGNGGNDTLYGLGGDDVLNGGAGNDVLDGGEGIDTADYSSVTSAVSVNLALGSAQNTLGAGVDTLRNIENLTGSDYEDTLRGNALANVLRGGAGNDTMRGEPGDDTLYGGDGKDRLNGNDGNDLLYGGGDDDTLYGDAGDDRLEGGEGDDRFYGGIGADQLYGGEGNDLLDGGAGADRMEGGAGDDLYLVDDEGDLTLEAFNGGLDEVRTTLASYTLGDNVENLRGMSASGQTLIGNDLDNTVRGGTGNDSLDGGLGNDKLYGGAGDDVMIGGEGDDRLYGGDGGDRLEGGAGADILSGEAGNDELYGDLGADQLNGGDGDDLLVGGAGRDLLTGGAGADIFRFAAGDSGTTSAARDWIRDFSHAQGDRVDLSGIDANTSTDEDDAFSFIGNAAFSHTAGELRMVAEGANWVVQGDVNGDGIADFAILVTGQDAPPVVSDFGL